MKRIALFVVLALLIVMPVAAQSETPAEAMPITSAVELILMAVVAAFGGWITSPTVTFFTGLLRHPLPNLNPRFIQFVLSGVLTIAFWVAARFGWDGQLQSALEALQAFIPALLTFIGILTGSTQAHEASHNRGIPVLGYKPGENGKVLDVGRG